MDIVDKARKLESRIARTLESAVQNVVGRTARQPIEVLHAVVDAAERQVQPAGRGRRVFPFDRIVVHFAVPSRTERAQFAALADGPPSLRERVVERLRALGCDARGVELDVVYAPKPKADWTTTEYHIAFERRDRSPATQSPAAMAPPRLELVVTAGAAARRSYVFTGGRIDIGRRVDVVDHRQRLVRTNHIAFAEEGSDTNKTVSRKHAHIIYVPASGDYRLMDDGSAHGTAVVRDGHTIAVPQGSRGIRLQGGDEIVLGEAKLKVRMQ